MTSRLDAIVRTLATRREAEEAALVLTALGIEHLVEHDQDGWRLVVDGADAARAGAALDEVARERSPSADAVPLRPITLAGVHVAVVLALIYLWTGARAGRSALFAAGEADARAILHGEWWRAVTALTLHADGMHLLGNALFVALFIGVLGGAVGTGVGLWITLVAGAGGNLLNAWFRAPLHQAVGASTAVFGAVGALSGVAAQARWRGARSTPPWVALGAGVALLAMLGSNVASDVGAHALGFVVGVPLGFGAAMLPRLGRAWQLTLSVLALMAVATAWRAVLG